MRVVECEAVSSAHFEPAFEITEDKFLGFVVHIDGIKIDEDKIKVILNIRPTKILNN